MKRFTHAPCVFQLTSQKGTTLNLAKPPKFPEELGGRPGGSALDTHPNPRTSLHFSR